MDMGVKRRIVSFFFLVLILSFGFNFTSLSFAAALESETFEDFFLVEVLSEPEDNKLYEIYLTADVNGAAVELIRRSDTEEEVFDVQDLITDQIVLAIKSGKDAVILKCPNCDPTTGGDLEMYYIYNGIINSYRIFRMKIFNNQGVWELYTTDGILINNLTLKSRKFLGQVIGIKSIVVNGY